MAKNDISTFVRGGGGWGGERGPSSDVNNPPDRPADYVATDKLSDEQALIYRLNGDWNPLHVDPTFATAFGFPKPILHGLCSFGYLGRHVVSSILGGDPRLFKSIKVRFADVVFPGETLKIELWKESDTRVIARVSVVERNKVVISNAAIELYKEIPQPKAKAAAGTQAASATSAAPAVLTSGDVFSAIGGYIGKHPDLVGSVGTVFQFQLKGPDSVWTIDLKNGKGAVTAGPASQPDCTLELADSDFLDMTTGKADPNKLYFGGKLKIGGNIMASQKLMFLKKIDRSEIEAALGKKGGAAPQAQAAPAQVDPASVLTSGDIFVAIKEYIADSPDLAKQIGTSFQFKLSGPDSAYHIDLKTAPGALSEGVKDADVTLTLSNGDFLDMVLGKANPQKLFMNGKLKIGGNVMASQKLEFLMKMDKKRVEKVVMARLGGGQKSTTQAAQPAQAATTQTAQAPGIIAALRDKLSTQPGLVADLGGTVQFVIKSPDAAFAVDATGKVSDGKVDGAVTTLTLTDEDLAALVAGKAEVKSLFQHGKLRVDGKVTPAHHLAFLSK